MGHPSQAPAEGEELQPLTPGMLRGQTASASQNLFLWATQGTREARTLLCPMPAKNECGLVRQEPSTPLLS